MSKIMVPIDNGHGQETLGKCSPDNTLREWEWTREVAAYVMAGLRDIGIESHLLVPETWDVPLAERVKRVNDLCRGYGADNVALVSIHVNAAGADGRWHNARGFLPYVATNAGQGSRLLARYLYEESERRGLKGNRCMGPQKYAVKSLAMCRDTKCAAVLTENLYMDNREDCAYLLSDEGKKAIVDMHVEAIKRYVDSVKS